MLAGISLRPADFGEMTPNKIFENLSPKRHILNQIRVVWAIMRVNVLHHSRDILLDNFSWDFPILGWFGGVFWSSDSRTKFLKILTPKRHILVRMRVVLSYHACKHVIQFKRYSPLQFKLGFPYSGPILGSSGRNDLETKFFKILTPNGTPLRIFASF